MLSSYPVSKVSFMSQKEVDMYFTCIFMATVVNIITWLVGYLDLSIENLNACKLKQTISSGIIEPRQPDVLGYHVRETEAILLRVQRLCLWAELHRVMLFLLPHPDDTQNGPVNCSTSFPRKGARVWEVGEKFSPPSPTTGWARISTQAWTGLVQQEDLGVSIVTCLETFICLKYKCKEK